MKSGIFFLTIAAMTAGVYGRAQSPSNADWAGIWNAHMDGLSTGTLTLATDTGELAGTVILDIISRDGGKAHVIAEDPHVLVGPRVDNGTLSFQVKITRPDGQVALVRFQVTRTAVDKASMHCTDCGDAPIVELVKKDEMR
jgi:hypothetical protein